MIGLVLLVGCGPSVDDLASERWLTRWSALDDLGAGQARALVPQLEKWAVLGFEERSLVADAALRALVRADTDASIAVVERLARAERGSAGVAALATEAEGARACALATELCAGEDLGWPADEACAAFTRCPASTRPSWTFGAGPPAEPAVLDRRALVWMDRDALRARFDEVEGIARTDPDPAVRAEAIRSLGYTGDPRALPLLDAWIGTEWGAPAADGLLAYGGAEGCARVERLASFDAGPIVDPCVDPEGERTSRARRWLLTRPCR